MNLRNDSLINLDSEVRDTEIFDPYDEEKSKLFELIPKKPKILKHEDVLDFRVDNVLLDVDAVFEEANKRKIQEKLEKAAEEKHAKEQLNLSYEAPPLTIKVERVYDMCITKSKSSLSDPMFSREILVRADYDIEENSSRNAQVMGMEQTAYVKKTKKLNEVFSINLNKFDEEIFRFYTRKDYLEIKAHEMYSNENSGQGKTPIDQNEKREKISEIKKTLELTPQAMQEKAFIKLVEEIKGLFTKLEEAKSIINVYMKEINLESYLIYYLIDHLVQNSKEDIRVYFNSEKLKFSLRDDRIYDVLYEYLNKITEFYTQNTEDKLGNEYYTHIAKPVEKYIMFLISQVSKFPFNDDFFKVFQQHNCKYNSLLNWKHPKTAKQSEKNVKISKKNISTTVFDPPSRRNAVNPINNADNPELSVFEIFKDIEKLKKIFRRYFHIQVSKEYKDKFEASCANKIDEPPIYNLNFNLISSLFLRVERFYADYTASCCTKFGSYLDKKFAHCFTCKINVCQNCLRFHSNHQLYDFANIYRNKIENINGYDVELFPKRNLSTPDEQANYYKTIGDIVLNFILRNTKNPIVNNTINPNDRFNDQEYITLIDYVQSLYLEFYFKEFIQIIKSKSYATKIMQDFTKRGTGVIDRIITNFNRVLRDNMISATSVYDFISSPECYKALITHKDTIKYHKENRGIVEEILVSKISAELNKNRTVVQSNKYNNYDFPQEKMEVLISQYNSPRNFFCNHFVSTKKPIMNLFLNNYYLSNTAVKEKYLLIIESQFKSLYEDIFKVTLSNSLNRHCAKYMIKILTKKSDVTGLIGDLSSKISVSLYKKDHTTFQEKLNLIKMILENHIVGGEKKATKQAQSKKRKGVNQNFELYPDIKDCYYDLEAEGKILVRLLEQKTNIFNVDSEDKPMNYLDDNSLIKNGFKSKLNLVSNYLLGVTSLIDHYGRVVYKKNY